jgi:3-deoxy-D-manno-octulosonic-acid transferase
MRLSTWWARLVEHKFIPWILKQARTSDCSYDEYKQIKKEADETVSFAKGKKP